MKVCIVIVALVFVAASGASAQTVKTTVLDGGSVQTELGFNIKINKGSALRRSWVVINESTAPVQLDGAGITTSYGDREYRYKATGVAKVTPAIAAIEVRFLLYDAFGNHIKTLSGTEVQDVAAGADLSLGSIGIWRAFENEISELLTTVAFVAHVRTSEGKVWKFDEKGIGSELAKIQLQVKSGVLDPTKQ